MKRSLIPALILMMVTTLAAQDLRFRSRHPYNGLERHWGRVEDIDSSDPMSGWKYALRDSVFYPSQGSVSLEIEADGKMWFSCSVLEVRKMQGYRKDGTGFKYHISLYYPFHRIRFYSEDMWRIIGESLHMEAAIDSFRIWHGKEVY